MAVSPADLDALATDVARVVQIAAATTGVTLAAPDVQSWSFEVDSGPEFREVVSGCYTWWREGWSAEIQTLAGLSSTHRPTLFAFTGVVNSLRTSHQHTHDPSARAFVRAAAWTKRACGKDLPNRPADWRACADAFGAEATVAAAALAGAAVAVAANPSLAKQWAAAAGARKSVDQVATADVVIHDLGGSYAQHRLEYLRRQIDAQWKRLTLTAADDAQAALEAVVEKVILGASLTSLDCKYMDVLDRLGVTGQQAAVPALWLAHAVAELGSHGDAAEFLDLVEHIWTQIVI